MTHGDDSHLFSCCQKKTTQKVEGRRRDSWRRLSTFFLLPEKGNTKSLGLSPWLMATTQKFCPVTGRKVTRKSWRLSPWLMATTLYFVFLIDSLKIGPKLQYCRFSSKNPKKIPIKKKLDYSTLLVQYVSKPRSTLTRKIFKNFKPAPNGPRPTVRLGPLLVVRGV